MFVVKLLSAVGVLRPARRRAFCPACKGWLGNDARAVTPSEVAPPALAAGAVLLTAGFAWVAMIIHSTSMGDMEMGLGSPGSFVLFWLLMMTAMMLPTAAPLVLGFARHAERRAGRHVATILLIATYLGVWLAFGVLVYLVYNALGMPWTHQRRIGGASLVVAAAYSLTRFKRTSDARCRELCALHGPLPFNLQHSAVLIAARYSLSCVGSSSALMGAMVLMGMSNLGWMALLSGLVLLYKLPLLGGFPPRAFLAAALAGMGIIYAFSG